FNADLSFVTTNNLGTTIETQTPGNTRTRQDNSTSTKDASGNVTGINLSGSAATKQSDNTWRVTVSGTTTNYRADGTLSATDASDGTHDEYDSQWRKTLHRTAGGDTSTYAYGNDGTKTTTYSDAHQDVNRKDGTLKQTI